MKNTIRKIMIFFLLAMLVAEVGAPIQTYAKEKEKKAPWVDHVRVKSATWNVSEGVTAYVEDEILHIEGNGAVPDYAADDLHARPWHGQRITSVWVDDGITEIGSNAFAKLGVATVRIPSTVFVKDESCFANIAQKSEIRISGKAVETKMIGTIPYTSAMSIISWVQNHQDYIVRTDFDKEAKQLFMTQNYPYLLNVGYSVDPRRYFENKNHWDPDFGNPTAPIARWITGAYEGYSLKCERYVPGRNTVTHFSNYVEDNTYVCAYRMWGINPTAKKIFEMPGTCTYQLELPTEALADGRAFKLIAVVDNTTAETVVFEDMNAGDTVFTFQSDRIPSQCVLVYKDPVTP